MHAVAVLCNLVSGAESTEAPNHRDFALRRDGELCVHDGVSQIGVFDASESDGRTRHARRGRLHSRYRRRSGSLLGHGSDAHNAVATRLRRKQRS